MQFPLRIRIGKGSLAHVIDVHDPSGARVAQARYGWWRLKVAVAVCADEAGQSPIGSIETDDIIDFAGTYRLLGPSGQLVGRSRRQGVKSLFRVRHQIDDGSDEAGWLLREERPWVRFLDSALGRIPVLGMFAGYVFNPTYLVCRGDTPIARLRQLRSFWESDFALDRLSPVDGEAELRLLLAMLTFLVVERTSRARVALPGGGGGTIDHGAVWR
ncbi:MAG: hypothetical protein JJ863_27895 [Deltaproteobacteria bacterium]|nr:hypothetical protein [Deltaproteobacteria bacterium]